MTDAKLLKSYVDRIERLEEEQAAIGGDKKDIFSEAKAHGFNTKVLRRLIRERKRDTAEREQEEAELETYRAALETGVALVKSGLSLREAAKQSGASKSSIHRALTVPEVSQESSGGVDGHAKAMTGAGLQVTNPQSRIVESAPEAGVEPGPLDTNSDDLEIPPALRRTRAA